MDDKLLLLKAKKAKAKKAEAQSNHDTLIEKMEVINKLLESLDTLEARIKDIESPDLTPLVSVINKVVDKVGQIDLGSVDVSPVAEQVKTLVKHAKGIEQWASRPVAPPQVTVNAKDNTKQFEAIAKSLDLIERGLKPSQAPEEFIPYRRVILDGNRFQFDDTRTSGSSVGGGGGGVSIDLPTWGIARIDDASDPTYFGFENNAGDWYILKEDDAAGTWKYFAGTGGITTNWAGRAGYAYGDKGTIF